MRKAFFEAGKKLLVRCLWLLIVTTLVSHIQPKVAEAQSVQVELMAATASWEAGEIGHAFMCISIPVGSGIKEDCYGFYPRVPGKAVVFGPGVVASEPTAEHITRFSRIAVSFKRPISDEQRRQIIKMTDAWNSRDYNFTSQNCIDFVDSIAHLLGWTTPPRVATDLPVTYLKKLVDANNSNPPGWYGFAGVLADRDDELRRRVGNFRRLTVNGNFNSLCTSIHRTCQRVIDWKGANQACSSGRDGTRLAFCQ
jgi:hypothetical protein